MVVHQVQVVVRAEAVHLLLELVERRMERLMHIMHQDTVQMHNVEMETEFQAILHSQHNEEQ